MATQQYIPGDQHPPGYVPKLRRRFWWNEDGTLAKIQWQRNCFSNLKGLGELAWKAIDTVVESDIADMLMEERDFTHDESDDVVLSRTGYPER